MAQYYRIPDEGIAISTKLHLLVKKGYHSPYVQLQRQNKTQVWRSVNYSDVTWQNLKDKAADIDSSLGQHSLYTGNLGRGFTVAVKPHEATGYWYVCLLKSSEETLAKHKCINLNTDEWLKLQEYQDNIIAQLKEYHKCLQSAPNTPTPQASHGVLAGPQIESKTVKQYLWGVSFPSTGHCPERGDWLFSQEACLRDGEEHKASLQQNSTEAATLFVDTRDIPAPSAFEVAKLVWQHSLTTEIASLCKKYCQGCIFDQANQLGHVNGGCLSPWEEQLQTYFSMASVEMDRDTLTRRVYQVLECLELPTVHASIATDAVLCFMDIADMNDTLMNTSIEPSYKALFTALFTDNKVEMSEEKPHVNMI